MSKFPSYYTSEIKKTGGIKQYVQEKAIEKKPLLDRVIKYARRRKRILEAGSGSAAGAIYLADKGYSVVCIDNDKKMIKIAKNNASLFNKQPEFLLKDILHLNYPTNYFDVAFSHGVLEHFSDEKISNLINAELKVSNFVIVSIPSDFFKPEEAINGDERFLNVNHWKRIIKKTNGTLIETFSYFYHGEELRIKALRMINAFTFGILPLKKPYIGFVIKNGI